MKVSVWVLIYGKHQLALRNFLLLVFPNSRLVRLNILDYVNGHIKIHQIAKEVFIIQTVHGGRKQAGHVA